MDVIAGNPMKLTTSSSRKKTWGALSWNNGVSQGTLVVKNLPANGGNTRDKGLTPGSGQSPGEGNGNPLLQSCLKNLMDRGACQAPVHGVAKSRAWQNWLRMLSVKREAKQKPGWALLHLDIVRLDGQSTSRSCGVHSLSWVALSGLMVKDSKFKPFDMSLKGRESQFVEAGMNIYWAKMLIVKENLDLRSWQLRDGAKNFTLPLWPGERQPAAARRKFWLWLNPPGKFQSLAVDMGTTHRFSSSQLCKSKMDYTKLEKILE